MQANDNDIQEIKKMLTGFISSQTKFNEDQKKFNESQLKINNDQNKFNNKLLASYENLDKKVDKIQYFLEETMASNAKMFFEEQIEMKTTIREMDEEINSLKNDLLDLSSRVNLMMRTS